MKTFITTLLVCLILIVCSIKPATTHAAGGNLPTDSNGKQIQGFAANGKFSVALTINSMWHDMTDFLAGYITAPADCKVRFSDTTGVKTGTVSEPVYGGTWNISVVDKQTPFWNTSGCTTGVLRRAK